MIKCYSLLIICKVVLIVSVQKAIAQTPVIKTNKPVISIRQGNVILKDSWTVSPQLKPDVYTVPVKGRSVTVSFITDIDSIRFTVTPGNEYSFIILYGNDSAYTEIRGEKFIEPAVFSKEYQKKFNGKTINEIPEGYELMNTVMALTDFQKKVEWHDEKRTAYYKEVQEYFKNFTTDTLINAINNLLNRGWYRQLKTDSYAFEFDKNGRIIKSKVYDRVDGELRNTVLPYIPLLEAFAAKTGFRDFYRKHSALYNSQLRAYRDTINTKEMVAWLNKNFPSTRYNAFKIIWSPLVGGNQSSKWFNNNGFKEAHAHVNFPYSFLFSGSKEIMNLKRGDIVFTELNHAFINPEAEKHHDKIIVAFTDKFKWAAKGKVADNYARNLMDLFNEYMNWGLVALHYTDLVPAEEMPSLIERNITYMLNRGFIKYREFMNYVLPLYQNRKKGETIADLYPQIITWFKENG